MVKAKRPTSFEAELAGVSRSTVSLVLNSVVGASISAATQTRVLAAARSLGYTPDAAGRTLASGRTHTLGLFICHAEHLQIDAFIPQALLGLNEKSREHGFKVIVEAVPDPAKPESYLGLVRAKQVDGLVVLNPRKNDEGLRRLALEDVPLVIMGASELPEAHTVSTRDNSVSAQKATEHLIGMGHTRIAHITYGGLEYQGADERYQGYRRALEGAGSPFDPALLQVRQLQRREWLRRRTVAAGGGGAVYSPVRLQRHRSVRRDGGATRARAADSGRCRGRRLRRCAVRSLRCAAADHGAFPGGRARSSGRRHAYSADSRRNRRRTSAGARATPHHPGVVRNPPDHGSTLE